MKSNILMLLAVSLLGALPTHAQAVRQAEPWDTERALELIQRAQQRRAETAVDTGLVNYQARAVGRVYFYLDREDTGERNLVKTDQLALEVLWQAPDLVKQRIIGWRDETSLPTNIQYHLDHLSVVQENFGDEIRIGDGDEVRGVVHPASPGAEGWYQYRLADSLTLSLPGAAEPVRVYEVEVRPRDPDRPGFVGSVFVERRGGDIVRMDFTFTGAAYVDPYLDYINISLDNGLWRGRYWLPNEQRVELRRRIPQIDIPAGTVIRANLRIQEYDFNEPLPSGTFRGPKVVALPREEREAFPFEEPIDAELREEGLGPAVELGEIREQARRLVRDRALRKLGGLRLTAGAVSDIVRYNRAEGLALGAGVSVRPASTVRLGALAGYAFGAEHPYGRVRVTAGEGTSIFLEGYLNRVEDVGIAPAASGVVNSLSALVAGRDYLDPYYATGVAAGLSRELGADWTGSGVLRLEEHEAASRSVEFSLAGGDFRGVRPIEPMERVAIGEIVLERGDRAERGDAWSTRLSLGLGRDVAGTRDWVEPRVDVGLARIWGAAPTTLEVQGSAGVLLGDPPPQIAYLLGGRGTVPGFPFRHFGGTTFATARAVVSADLAEPWLGGRALANVGWTGGTGVRPEPVTGSPRISVGAGVALLYDILRVDLVRGLGPLGRWELVFETRDSFRDFL